MVLNKIVKKLAQAEINSAAIHGNKSQTARQKALGAFKDGKLKVLVATDIAARGIDVEDLALVINLIYQMFLKLMYIELVVQVVPAQAESLCRFVIKKNVLIYVTLRNLLNKRCLVCQSINLSMRVLKKNLKKKHETSKVTKSK